MLASMVACGTTVPPADVPAATDNTEMQAIVDADQADREPDLKDLDWAAMAGHDASRRARVRT